MGGGQRCTKQARISQLEVPVTYLPRENVMHRFESQIARTFYQSQSDSSGTKSMFSRDAEEIVPMAGNVKNSEAGSSLLHVQYGDKLMQGFVKRLAIDG